jgi:Fuc2NAc and GlcNAc transferase
MSIKAALFPALAVLLGSGVLTWLARRLALAHGVLDKPNERSSHVVPTPRGGGAAIVLVTTLALIALLLKGDISLVNFGVLVGGALPVALVGFVDDRRPLSTRVRLGVHFGAAIWAVVLLGGLPPVQVGPYLLSFGWAG